MIVQAGIMPLDAKPLKGVGSGVFEIVTRYDGDTYRTVYAIKISRHIYVLHVFQKKSDTPGEAGGLMSVTAPRADASPRVPLPRIVHFGLMLLAHGYIVVLSPPQIQPWTLHNPLPKNSLPHNFAVSLWTFAQSQLHFFPLEIQSLTILHISVGFRCTYEHDQPTSGLQQYCSLFAAPIRGTLAPNIAATPKTSFFVDTLARRWCDIYNPTYYGKDFDTIPTYIYSPTVLLKPP
jgi:hypothetical protein